MIRILKRINYLEHYALWAFLFLFVFDYHFWEDNWWEAVANTSIEMLVYVLIFYLNYKLLIPLFLEKEKNARYLLALILSLFVYLSFLKLSSLEVHLYDGNYWRNLMSMVINFTLFWLLSTLYWYYHKLQDERETQLRVKAEKLEAEMRFLKNQMSPHFLFNTLNNIYSLVQQSHQNAAPMLAKLSSILRYILYDSSKERVPMGKEIKVIQDYIALQLLRQPKSTNIDLYLEGNLSNLSIAPMLLLNFVENSFKHSNLDQSADAWINISCISDENNKLEFLIENSKAPSLGNQQKNGLGNINVQRQLAMTYANAYELEMEDDKGIFSVKLSLQLGE